MTVYNTPFDFVKRAIKSVLNQDYTFFELIVIDDGSSLSYSKSLSELCQLYQNKIIYLNHQNCGQSQSINKGIKMATGKFITIIDSDDEYKINHLSSCMNEMRNADLISSFTETIVNKEEDYYVPDKDNYKKNIHVDECIMFATLFGKREVFESISFQNRYAADALFYQQASNIFKVKKANFRTYRYFRNNSKSISATLKKNQS